MSKKNKTSFKIFERGFKFSWPSWIRTNTHRTKICSPAIRRWAKLFPKRECKYNQLFILCKLMTEINRETGVSTSYNKEKAPYAEAKPYL